jgi:hypothetical protein
LIYFIAAGHNGPIKIGSAKRPDERLKELQTGSPQTLYILAVREGDRNTEAAFHQVFEPHRIRGEWFKREPIEQYLEGVYGTQMPKTEFGMEWPCAGDCCPECEGLAVISEPHALVDNDGSWVKLAYRCVRGHAWTCGWSVNVARYGLEHDPTLTRTRHSTSFHDPYLPKIKDAIATAGPSGLPRSEIRKHLGSNAISTNRILKCLAALEDGGIAKRKRDSSGNGRPTELWTLVEHNLTAAAR